MRRRALFRNRNNNTPNTFIGGVSSVITSKTILAGLLNIDESAIGYFGVVGSDIEAAININYTLPSTLFNGYTASPSRWRDIGGGKTLTYFKDIDKKVTSAGHRVFFDQPNFTEFQLEGLTYFDYDFCRWTAVTNANLPAVTSANIRAAFQNASPALVSLPNLVTSTGDINAFGYAPEVYIPNCTQLGTTAGNDTLFAQSPTGVIITANSALQTSNAGAEEGDIAYARTTKSAVITYV